MHIGIVGLGLIGGSLAKAVKAKTAHTVLAFDKNEEVLSKALSDKAVDAVLDENTLSSCQIVLVALYPQAAVDYIRTHQDHFAKDGIVVDCCGVKEVVCTPCAEAAAQAGFTFIGGHPMAGIEKAGFDHSFPTLFEGASMVLTPEEGTDQKAVRTVSDLCGELGFGRIQISTPKEHDRMIALTSQLAHVLSSAYVKSPAALSHAGFSAGSFKDMTRVAWLNENMWTELFFDNKAALLDEIDGLIDRLQAYSDALRRNDKAWMHSLLKEGRERKEIVG
ncbi:MAG: prephenate dehydrogenase/arogenate dehydrogenase family protein [Oscillospiraceae bacterium]|nr:prephenate dehydrogenase/arogenate dehydrogenase family protein [Oscillospiraceae bacterium]